MLHDTQISATFKLHAFSEKKVPGMKIQTSSLDVFLPNHFTFDSKQPLCVIHVAETYTFFFFSELMTNYRMITWISRDIEIHDKSKLTREAKKKDVDRLVDRLSDPIVILPAWRKIPDE